MLAHFIHEGLDFIHKEQQFFCIRISSTIYKKEAVLKAAYQFTDRCYIHVEPVDEQNYLVRVMAKEQHDDSETLAREFCNELIDQELRIAIAQETEAVRNLILAHALSKTSLIEPEYETADYIEDPLNIARQDER